MQDNKITAPKTHKPWGNGPELVIIDQYNVNGGGPNSDIWERTGHRVNEISTSVPVVVRHTVAATTGLYNNAAVHS